MSGSQASNFRLGLLTCLQRGDCFATEPVNQSAAQALIITLRNLVRISADHLEFQAGTHRGKYMDFHLQNKTWSRSSNTTISLILA